MKNLFVIIPFLFVTTIQAQDFKSAVGLRLGTPTSISYKHFMKEKHAIEAYVGTKAQKIGFGYTFRWYNIGVNYQIHKELNVLDGLSAYYGGGISTFFWTFEFETDASAVSIGLQGVGGLSYMFKDLPLNINIDWTPTVFLNGYSTNLAGLAYGNIGIRYILSR